VTRFGNCGERIMLRLSLPVDTGYDRGSRNLVPLTSLPTMAYFLDLFSPETYEAFTKSDQTVSGFRVTQRGVAKEVKPGDRLLCYMTKLSRWVGVLEVQSNSFEDDSPVFYPDNDPFTIRFKVKPLIWLKPEESVPIRDARLFNQLSFTRDHDPASSRWTGKLRGSLNEINEGDAKLIEDMLVAQTTEPRQFPIDQKAYSKLSTHRVKRADRTVSVSVPVEEDDEEVVQTEQPEVRESIQIQALLARIGAEMGLKIWLPRNNRAAVLVQLGGSLPLLDDLPLSYDETTIKTIEQIDVLWLKGRAIKRAFEVEHTTSIYSGLLRMADLLALQPNMAINLHIVAPSERRDKVFQEILRPVFSLLGETPLSDMCTYMSYDSVRSLNEEKHLGYLTETVLDEYAETAE
jgi:predicted RNA-binding protein